jgi:alanyl-tRNA synthetase
MKASVIKEKFLSFFEAKAHKRIASAPLVPENDPTVLFTTAGMHPLVPFLMGEPHPLGNRLTNAQKCVRTGDIDEVGDASHLTFFEMLGNWSLGDYFKEDAIQWSFEFLTQELGLKKELMAVSVFIGDDDAPFDQVAHDKWLQLGMDPKRIARLPKKQNWWGPAGETGPCGPDTEMFYWTGNPDEVPESFNDDHELWVEIWNDVFMQYDKQNDGSFKPLTQKNVDTGMGLERIAMVMQRKDNVYAIDSMQPVVDKVKEVTQTDNEKSIRILTDHIRTAVFMLADERTVLPSNVDQGYVLRKIIRRSVRHLFLHKVEDVSSSLKAIAQVVIEQFADEYAELQEKKDFILDELVKESNKFITTIEKSLKLVDKKMISEAIAYFDKKPKSHEDTLELRNTFKETETTISLSGKWLFDLFQSQGLPPEMAIEEIADSYNCIIENKEMALDEFEKLFIEHQEMSRAGAEQKFKGGLADGGEATTKLHTATHLLNEALRKVISPDIKQRGSNITPERLRFDFNFERKLTPEEIAAVEDEVNAQIKAALPVTKEKMKLDAALAAGAQAEFGQKYPEEVWVYSIGEFSKELCGGPHVTNTKELGTFRIKKEQSSAAGIRRIKAIVE